MCVYMCLCVIYIYIYIFDSTNKQKFWGIVSEMRLSQLLNTVFCSGSHVTLPLGDSGKCLTPV